MAKHLANILTISRIIGSIMLLFLLPLTISFAGWKYPAMAVCAVATCSAIQESLIIIGDMYDKS